MIISHNGVGRSHPQLVARSCGNFLQENRAKGKMPPTKRAMQPGGKWLEQPPPTCSADVRLTPAIGHNNGRIGWEGGRTIALTVQDKIKRVPPTHPLEHQNCGEGKSCMSATETPFPLIAIPQGHSQKTVGRIAQLHHPCKTTLRATSQSFRRRVQGQTFLNPYLRHQFESQDSTATSKSARHDYFS